MSGGLVGAAVRRPIGVAVVALAICILGWIAVTRLPVDLMPEVDFPRISVVTRYEGVGPEEIENLLTRPIEQAVSTIDGVTALEAESAEGLSRVQLQFDWGTDLDAAVNDVRAQLDRLRATLPEDADAPIVLKFDISSTPIATLGLSGGGDPRRLRYLADELLTRRLERIPGIASVQVNGGRVRELRVELDVDRLVALGVTGDQVVRALGSNNRNVAAGDMGESGREVLIRTVGELGSVEDIENVLVTRQSGRSTDSRGLPNAAGRAVYVRDVANVSDAFQEIESEQWVDGVPGIVMRVSKQSGANTVEVVERLRAELALINDEYDGRAHVIVVHDSSTYIKSSITNVREAALYGAALAVLILLAFLRDLRATFIVALAIPFSVMATFALMYFSGYSLNLISFGGLALGIGMLVDNAIVIVENIYRKREEGLDPHEAAVAGAREVTGAIVAGTLTTVAVFAPVVFLAGFAGVFFAEMAMVVVFSLLCSLVIAVTLIPTLAARLLAAPADSSEQTGIGARVADALGRWFASIDAAYVRVMDTFLRRRWLPIAAACVLLLGAVRLVPFVQVELMPQTDEGVVDLDFELPVGTPVERTREMVHELERRMRGVCKPGEIDNIVSSAGPDNPYRPGGGHEGEVELTLVPVSERDRGSAEILAEMRKAVAGLPDVTIRLRQRTTNPLQRFMRGSQGERLVVEIRGHDLDTAADLARRVEATMKDVPGIVDVRIGREEGLEERTVEVDTARAADLGLTRSDVALTLETYVLGRVATRFRDAGDEYDVRVMLREEDRDRTEQLADLPILSSQGVVPLSAVATVDVRRGPGSIAREGQERVLTIAGGLGDRPLSAVVAELEAALAGDDMDAMLAALAASEAGVISVQLPPAGVPLTSNRLPVYGTTLPTNEVYVGGNRIDVGADGRFHTVVELPGGSSVLLVETRDREGNRGQLEWPVEVANSSFFLMAIADTALGNRHADIAGMNDDNHITTDGGVTAYGQARLYFKGWVSGAEVLNGFFDDVEITAHLDTAKRREYESFVREVIEPERSYPVYGDASQQVSDVNARGKVYVLLQAGDSSATWGNFNTAIRGVELLAYERNLHGARVVFDETIADDFHTEIQAHVADEEADRVQTYNYLRGTGGSIYYLENRQVVEGTERVAVVIRDSVSGVELARMPMTRNTDYTFRYSEGRIVLKSPLPSVVDDGLLLGNYTTTRSTLRGHAVYLEVAYDHLGGRNDSETSYGVHVRETLYDWVSVGGGVVRESRGDAQGYSLWGVEAGVGPTESTRVDVEYARSESQDLGYAYSDDGGLTFDRFREDMSTDTPTEGDAMLVHAQFELADVLTTDRDHIWSVDGRYQRADRGFYANGRILDQGEERYGLASQLRMHEHHAMQLRLDRVNTVVDDLQSTGLGDLVETRRQVAVAEYLYNDHPAELRLAYQHTYGDDARLPDSYANDIVGVSIGVHVLRWLRLGAGQEIVVNGNDPNVIRGAGGDTDTRFEDRFITSVSTGIRVTDTVEIEASERFRYSGENSAMVGVNVRTDDDTRVYAQQRFDSPRDNGGGAMNTVVGGEQLYGRDGSGRAYGEYQTQSGVSGERSRALLGFGKRWQIVDGLSIDAGYEHSNTLSALSVESENSRDTLSLGWEWSQLDALKLTGLLEGRFEQGSVHSPAAATCLAGAISGNPAYCRDEVRAVGDRRQLVSMTSAQAQATRDLTLFGRFDIVATENTTLRLLESRDVEGTIAAAYRPIDHNWVNLLLRYTYLSEMAPYQLELNQRRDEWSHVFSLSPVFELPFNFQLAEKVAYRQLHLRVEGMPEVRNDIVLLANRINYHLFRQWDVGVEYRFLHQSLTGDWRHGTLVEANYIVADHVRLGLGYNFTRFAEDELGDFDSDRHGFYFRVTAQY